MIFKAAICPSCGGQLQVPDDRDVVMCMYCGTEIVVREAIQAGSGINIENYLKLAATEFDSRHYKEASDYYTKILETDIHNSEAWLGRVIVEGHQYRLSEMKTAIQNGIQFLSDEEKSTFITKSAEAIGEISRDSLDRSSRSKYNLEKFLPIIEFGHTLDPSNTLILQAAIDVYEGKLVVIESENNTCSKSFKEIESEKKRYNDLLNDYITKFQKINPDYFHEINPSYTRSKIDNPASKDSYLVVTLCLIFFIYIYLVIMTHKFFIIF